MLAVLVSTISNSQVFLLKTCKCKSYSHFFSKNISIYAIFDGQRINDTLTNDIVSFEQLGPHFWFQNRHSEGESTVFTSSVSFSTVAHFAFCFPSCD